MAETTDPEISLGYNIYPSELTETAKLAQARLLEQIRLAHERDQDNLMSVVFNTMATGFGLAKLKVEGSGVRYEGGPQTMTSWRAYLTQQGIKRALYRTTTHVLSLRHRSPRLYAVAKKITRARHWLADRVIDIAETHIGGKTYDRDSSGGW